MLRRFRCVRANAGPRESDGERRHLRGGYAVQEELRRGETREGEEWEKVCEVRGCAVELGEAQPSQRARAGGAPGPMRSQRDVQSLHDALAGDGEHRQHQRASPDGQLRPREQRVLRDRRDARRHALRAEEGEEARGQDAGSLRSRLERGGDEEREGGEELERHRPAPRQALSPRRDRLPRCRIPRTRSSRPRPREVIWRPGDRPGAFHGVRADDYWVVGQAPTRAILPIARLE